MTETFISIQLSRAKAVVLFDFLYRFSEFEKLEIEDQAEERVLWDILADLKKEISEPFDPMYLKLLEIARSEVRDEVF